MSPKCFLGKMLWIRYNRRGSRFWPQDGVDRPFAYLRRHGTSFLRHCHHDCSNDCQEDCKDCHYDVFMPIANETAKIAIITSSCRLPPGLLAAGMPLEFRLTLYLMPTDYQHLHQTVKFRSINSVPPLRSNQHWRMGSPWFCSYLTYILDLDASCPHLCWRFYDGLYVILRFMAAPTREMRHSLWLTHLTTLPMLTCLANSGRRWLPIRCSRNLWNTPTDCQDSRCARPHFSERRISGLLAR